MNTFAQTVAWLAIQVTALLVPATACHLFASRRGPAAGASVAAAALGLTLGLTACAPCVGLLAIRLTAVPVAAVTPGPAASTAGRPPEPQASAEHPPGLAISWRTLAATLRNFEHRVGEASAPHAGGLRIAAWGLLTLAAIGSSRLALGLLEVRRCRRRGAVLRDQGFLGELESLRTAMGVLVPIEVRELPEAIPAATAGWRRPVILLPADWRAWPVADLRAVLAHELAHIRRSDYVIGLVAGLAQALHAYHPLVAWLASRLRMAQEQAADALAAEVSGGRHVYRAVLARMALEQDVGRRRWPVSPFSPTRGTLIRRIQMLESNGGEFDRSGQRSHRWQAGGLLAAVALVISLVPNPLRASPPSDAAAETRPGAIPAFDLSYIPTNAMGVFACRPSEISRRPRVDALCMALTFDIGAYLAELGEGFAPFWGEHPLMLNEIEQVTCGLQFGLKPDERRELRSFAMASLMLRTVRPYDWNGLIRAVWPDATEHHVEGKVYFKVKALSLGTNPCFSVADDRTLIHMQEDAIVAILGRPSPMPPLFVQRAEWKEVERDFVTVVLDNSRDRIRAATRREETLDKDDAFARFISLAERVFFGLSTSDDVRFNMLIFPRDGITQEKLARMVEQVRDLSIKDLLKVDDVDDLSPRVMRSRGLLVAILRSIVISRESFGLRLANQPSTPDAAVKLIELLVLDGKPKAHQE
ncbi:BlaR1 peptidase M56 [Aquisphaera giovannonii]|uniref:BlaR1 peptidase M56 n=1 Tax=Aquisphaera giovannonii TaxID=406548 RepID=A0A5B9VZT8_9BACT|nr:M56 family metallopeptidase [Aquisphaera giovannonii]QEH33295.1 BlaR1 peptidase M56 [Aquisphaera giovannonii]